VYTLQAAVQCHCYEDLPLDAVRLLIRLHCQLAEHYVYMSCVEVKKREEELKRCCCVGWEGLFCCYITMPCLQIKK
jgi:hypothetical protein